MNRTLLFVTIFSFGYMFNDVLKEFDLNLINEVSAEVAGMDYFELVLDPDFQSAVEYIFNARIDERVENIVEDCEVEGYVDDDWLYGGSISC